MTKPILIKTILLLLLGLLLSPLLITHSIQAKTPAAPAASTARPLVLTAIPPRLGDDGTLHAKPGEKIQVSVKVRNASEFPLQIQSTSQDFMLDENGETPIAITETVSNRWSLASWMILSPATQELTAGQMGIVNVIIDVPLDALPGGHYAMITHHPGDPRSNNAQSASVLQQRVGTLVYLLVEGPINEQAFIRDFHMPRFSEYGPVPFSFLVDNQSDVHLQPQVSIEVYNLFGRQVDTISVPSKNVFPYVGRTFDGQWDRIWGFGPYTAKVVMSYGSQGQVSLAITKFWLLPITLVAAAAISLLAILAILITIKRHLNYRRAQQKSRGEMLEQRLHQLKDKNKQLDQFDT